MTKLEIYDPPLPATSPVVNDVPRDAEDTSILGSIYSGWRRVVEVKQDVCSEVSRRQEQCHELEQQVLSTVKPVTKFVPISYDTVKRSSVVTVCTLSGILQGRRRGGFRRILYPLVGLGVGSAACFPDQTLSTVKSTSSALAATGPALSNAVSKMSALIQSAQPEPAAPAPADDIKQFLEEPVEQTIEEATKVVIEDTKEAIIATEHLLASSEDLVSAVVNEVVAVESECVSEVVEATVGLVEAVGQEVTAVKEEVAAVEEVIEDVAAAVKAIEGEGEESN